MSNKATAINVDPDHTHWLKLKCANSAENFRTNFLKRTGKDFFIKSIRYCKNYRYKTRIPGFESGISHNDPDALQVHCVLMYNSG